MKKNCNVCKKKIKLVLDLGKHPCADTFLSTKEKALKIKKYPLKVGYCSCHHLSSIEKISDHERYKQFDQNNKIEEISFFSALLKYIGRTR